MKKLFLLPLIIASTISFCQKRECLIDLNEFKLSYSNDKEKDVEYHFADKFIEACGNKSNNQYKNNFYLLMYVRDASKNEIKRRYSRTEGLFYYNEKIYKKEDRKNAVGIFLLPTDYDQSFREISIMQKYGVFHAVNPNFKHLTIDVIKDKAFTIESNNYDCAVLNLSGRRILIYKEGFLQNHDFFISAKNKKRLEKLKEILENYIGREIIIEKEKLSIQYKKGNDKEFQPSFKYSMKGILASVGMEEDNYVLNFFNNGNEDMKIKVEIIDSFKLYDSECNNTEKEKERKKDEIIQSKKDSVYQVISNQLNLYAKGRKSISLLKRDTLVFNYLKRQFFYDYDKFNKTGLYTHFNFRKASYSETYLSADLTSYGKVTLISHYYHKDWLFHTKIKVLIGSKTYSSVEVKSYDPNNTRDNSSGSIWETIYYTKGRDNGIYKAIAKNCCMKEVSIRFIGSKYYSDKILNNNFVIGLRDTYVYSMYLKIK